MPTIGQSVRRVDAYGKVIGETLYPGDINLPNQAYMKILFSDRPHAIVRNVDTREALDIPGVIAAFTAKDVPVNEYGLIIPDQPVLCGPGSSKLYTDRVRFVGDQIAVVVAETDKIAALARDKIRVDYVDLPIINNPVEGMKDDSELLHPDRGSNVFCHYRIRKGDADAAMGEADVVIESEYKTPAQEHAYLQPEAGISYIDDEGRITVEVAGQWVHEEREQIAHSLGISEDRVRVIHPAIGGAFGGREDISIQIVLALAVEKLNQRGVRRPIKIIWSREESILGHHKRHPYIISTKWGATKEGKIIAAEANVIADGGAYAYTSTKVLGNATLMCTGPYEIPNVSVDSFAVYTNNVPGGAFRGFGGPQGAFAAETQINKLAEALDMDPVELRVRNVLREGDLLSVGTPLPQGVSLPQVVEECAIESGWKKNSIDEWELNTPKIELQPPDLPSHIKRGVGFACGFKNVGFSFGAPEQSYATVELFGKAEIEKVVLRHAGAEVGQGAHTVMVQMAAEALDVPMDIIELVTADTVETDDSGSSSASRMTFMSGNSIRGAAKMALEKWKNEDRPSVATYQYRPPATTPFDPVTGKSEPNFAYGYVAQAAIVEVDMETGHVRILDIVSTNDVGRAVNPQQVIGQVEGGVVQAVGYSILENFIQEDGYVMTPHLSTYLIPGVLDIPEQVRSVILEYPDPKGPWGARGMAEMPFIPVAPVIVGALHHATGEWFDDFPLTPERVLRGLGKI